VGLHSCHQSQARILETELAKHFIDSTLRDPEEFLHPELLSDDEDCCDC